jgi:DNA replication initiation complex subunit (GINS family)
LGDYKERAHLKELYPAEFAELYEDALERLPSLEKNVGEIIRKTAAEVQALEALRERHGIVK